MKTNKAEKKPAIYTNEGGKASHISDLEELKRATMSCLLWEDNFYEDGVSIADRITSLVKNCIDKGHYDDVIDILKTVKCNVCGKTNEMISWGTSWESCAKIAIEDWNKDK